MGLATMYGMLYPIYYIPPHPLFSPSFAKDGAFLDRRGGAGGERGGSRAAKATAAARIIFMWSNFVWLSFSRFTIPS